MWMPQNIPAILLLLKQKQILTGNDNFADQFLLNSSYKSFSALWKKKYFKRLFFILHLSAYVVINIWKPEWGRKTWHKDFI